jgi:L-iditol 2-dehydrogenase
MKALMFDAPWSMPFSEVSAPKPRENEVIVKVHAVGICGSDVHGFTGSTGRRNPGIIMGHEFSGTILEIGSDVTDPSMTDSSMTDSSMTDSSGWNIGDRVVVNPLIACLECRACKAGNTHGCANRRGIGWSVNGAYAEMVSVPVRNLRRLPEPVSDLEGSLIEPLAVALRAVNLTPFELGATVAVVGAGPIGLLALMALKLKGAGTVIVSDLSEHRLGLARRLGADLLVNAKDDPVQFVRDATNGDGADAVLEAVGVTPSVRQAIGMARTGGAITWIGNSAPNVEVPMQEIVTRELRVQGSYGFDLEFDRTIELLAARRLNVMPLIEKIAPLEQGEALMTALARNELEAVKVVLQP